VRGAELFEEGLGVYDGLDGCAGVYVGCAGGGVYAGLDGSVGAGVYAGRCAGGSTVGRAGAGAGTTGTVFFCCANAADIVKVARQIVTKQLFIMNSLLKTAPASFL
jgi:hypothetical protein